MAAARKLAPPIDARRRGMIAKVKIAQKALGLSDADYRAVLHQVAGKSSAADCNDHQLGLVLDNFKAKGWKAKPAGAKPGAPAAADHPSAKKARAMWISLHQLGVVRDAGDHALEAFARRQLKVERLQWADQGLCYKLIEALKAMAKRAGWDQTVSGAGRDRDEDVVILKRSLIRAQAKRLGYNPPLLFGLQEEQLDAIIRDLAGDIHAEATLQPEA